MGRHAEMEGKRGPVGIQDGELKRSEVVQQLVEQERRE